MSKKKFKKHHNKIEQEPEENKFKLSKFLTPEERKQFKIIGEPDFKQNWLELFTPTVVNDLITIKNSCSDNNQKAKYIMQEMSYYGFEILGQGTNILPLINPAYPGVVFKVALDDCGIADNFNDCILQTMIPYYCELAGLKNPENRYTKVYARHPSSIVSVQRRDIVIKDPRRLDSFRGRILKLMKILSNDFLIADLSPDRFLNYGVGRDGEFTILDGSDLYPMALIKDKLCCNNPVGMDKHKRLKRCEGKLHYNGDFSKLVCEKCGKEFNPVEFRPNKEENNVSNVLMDGYSKDERIQMEMDEQKAICDRRTPTTKHDDNIQPYLSIHEAKVLKERKTKVPDSCYKEFGSDLDGCSRQEREGCQGCSCLESTPSNDNVIYIDHEEEDEPENIEQYNVDESHTREVCDQYDKMKNPKSVDIKDTGSEYEEEDDEEDSEPSHLVYVKHTYEDDENDPVDESESREEEEVDPHIDINVIDNDGIYLTVHGSLDEAWEESGIPIFISFDNKQTYTRIVSTSALKTLIKSNCEQTKQKFE